MKQFTFNELEEKNTVANIYYAADQKFDYRKSIIDSYSNTSDNSLIATDRIEKDCGLKNEEIEKKNMNCL